MPTGLEASGSLRMAIALTTLGVLAVAVSVTMDPGRYRTLTWVLLGFFAVRVILGWLRSRKMEEL